MELNGTVLHDRRHAQFNGESSGCLVYASISNYIPELILITKEHLDNSGIKYHKVPCESLVKFTVLTQ